MTEVTEDGESFIIRLLNEGYQIRFYYETDKNSKVVYGFVLDGDKISAVYHKGIKDFAHLKNSKRNLSSLFEPLTDKHNNKLELKLIKAYPPKWRDCFHDETTLDFQHEHIMNLRAQHLAEFRKPRPSTQNRKLLLSFM